MLHLSEEGGPFSHRHFASSAEMSVIRVGTSVDSALFLVNHDNRYFQASPEFLNSVDTNITIYEILCASDCALSLRTVEALAKQQVQLIRKVQECGPYYLIGL